MECDELHPVLLLPILVASRARHPAVYPYLSKSRLVMYKRFNISFGFPPAQMVLEVVDLLGQYEVVVLHPTLLPGGPKGLQ